MIHLDDGRAWRGGQHQVALLIGGLARSGVGQTLVAPPGSPLALAVAKSGAEVVPYDFRGEWDWRAPKFIADLSEKIQAQIFHAHTAHAHALAIRAHKRLAREGKGDKTRIVTTRRVDFPVARGFFSRRKYLYSHQHYIAISEAVRNELIKGGVEANRIDLVPSGVPPIPADQAWDPETARKNFGIKDNEIAIVAVGALTDHKGHRWLIGAAPQIVAAFPSARIHILGEGELRGELESLIARLGMKDFVRLHGHVPDARLKLAGFDLYVSSSHLEGLGTAILDAMLAGLPVVAASAGGVTDVVRHGKTGWLVPARDSSALATEVVRVLNLPLIERQRLVEAAKANVEERFSAGQMVAGTLAVYRRILALSY